MRAEGDRDKLSRVGWMGWRKELKKDGATTEGRGIAANQKRVIIIWRKQSHGSSTGIF